ncbi:MAG: hypothetical protein AB1896_09505 [Thermodesulfobacteriota bacterium]
MAGPVHMNQVLYQTPTVEKIQQAELQGQDQAQRHVAIEEKTQLQQRTETVQKLPESQPVRVTENEPRKREKRRARPDQKKTPAKAAKKESRPTGDPKDQGPGGLVDVVI